MDFTTIVGIVVGLGLILYGIGPAQMMNFVDPGSLAIVFGGTLAVLVASYPLRVLKQLPKVTKILITENRFGVMEYIDQLQEMAIIARKNGLLALEDKANEAEDPFFKSGLMLIVDATSPEKVRELLTTDLDNIEERHGELVEFYEKGAGYAPGFGLIGTLIGLVNMLANMNTEDGTDGLSKNMALAMITTFYGSVLSNLVFLPIAKKLQVRSDEEILCKRVIIEGILSIQAGENPTFLREKLITFLPQYIRDDNSKKDKDGGE